MHISNISLENFRCFEKAEFTFGSGFNVLMGDNGTGKTSLLLALAYGLTKLISDPNHSTLDQIIVDIDIRQKIDTIQSSVPVLEIKRPSTVDVNVVISEQEVIALGCRSDGYTNISHKQNQLPVHFVRSDGDTAPVVLFLSSKRSWLPSPIEVMETLGALPRSTAYENWRDFNPSDKALLLWIKTLEFSALQRGQKNPILESMRQAVRVCMTEDQPNHIYFDVLLGELCIRKQPEGSEPIPVRFLSDGQINMLSLVMNIAYRAAVLNPHLGENAPMESPGIILIDELDLHLHPKWQVRVVDDLKRAFPKMQFIVTTHSPLIIQSLQAGELLDLNDGDPGDYVGKSPEDILENVMEVPLPQQSERWKQMYAAAEEYYQLLEEAEGTEGERLTELRQRLDHLMLPYTENPAFAAYTEFLKQKCLAAGVDAA